MMADLPVACTLDPAALEARREGLLAQLMSSVVRRDDLSNGWRLEFEPTGDTLALIARAIEGERKCCRFLQFRLTVSPDEGPVVLELTGPAGTREFLAALLDEGAA
jgi:hypothetical protein